MTLPNFVILFVQRYIFDEIFVKMQSVVLSEVANKQADKRQMKHNRHGGGRICQ